MEMVAKLKLKNKTQLELMFLFKIFNIHDEMCINLRKRERKLFGLCDEKVNMSPTLYSVVSKSCFICFRQE